MERKGMRNMGNQENNTKMTPPDMNCGGSAETCEPPEGFDGEAPELPEEMENQEPTDMRGGGMRREDMAQLQVADGSSATWHPAAYLGFGAGSVILGILVSYACFSKFFHLKPGQAFSSASKFVWFIVVALVIATGLCVLGYFIPVWTA